MTYSSSHKNLILFFPWNEEELDVFRNCNRENRKGEKDDRMKIVEKKVVMTDTILFSMGFEDAKSTDDPFITKFFTEEDWEFLKNRNTILGETEPRNPNWKIAENLKMLGSSDSGCRGWIIDVKKLTYYRLTDYSLVVFKGKTEVIKSFDDLEIWVEKFKHKFASKKFGI